MLHTSFEDANQWLPPIGFMHRLGTYRVSERLAPEAYNGVSYA
jgi:hypothetical protein